MSLRSGERQVAERIEDIRADHVARYRWAAKMLPAGCRVLDFGCGIGYGAIILAEAGHRVEAWDPDAETIEFAMAHFAHPNIQYVNPAFDRPIEGFDAVVAFEVIEHMVDPAEALDRMRAVPLLLASVPNEDVFPFKGYKFHHRHYRKSEFAELLTIAGFTHAGWWGQYGPSSDVEADVSGRTLLTVAQRDVAAPIINPERPKPKHIAIVAFGPTSAFYIDAAKKEGNRKRFADFVIGVNAMGSVIQSDLVFHMDDVRIQERRAAADPEGHVAGIVEWLREYRGRVMTSRAHPDYPHLEEFPLEDLLNKFGGGYINGTGAAALAYAIYLEPEEISLWGFDFTYPNAHKNEKGRACVEYWLGRAQERGIGIRLPPKTSLLDSFEDSASDEAKIYGYDTVKLRIAFDPGANKFRVMKTPLPESEWPTAAEVEAAYDHTKHPSLQGRNQS